MSTMSEPCFTTDTGYESSQAHSYNALIQALRSKEYPTLDGTVYLDHAGTIPYAKSLVEAWSNELTNNLFGNPHSASASSQLSTRRIDEVRLKALRFFGADPDHFELVFVANATAAMKLVAEAFRDAQEGFRFLYHGDSHTSLVGCREMASQGSDCLMNDGDVDDWLRVAPGSQNVLTLFAFPGQSNMTGRKLPIDWTEQVASLQQNGRQLYTLLDVASLAATSPLTLDFATAADFTCVSFYKIFGLPDLGGLIVKKSSAHVLMQKKYFAGGTVDAVTLCLDSWHARKLSVSAALEEGTLPFHNILALDHAMNTHKKLFQSMHCVSRHTSHLSMYVRAQLRSLRHFNGSIVASIYGDDLKEQHGPVISFNLLDSRNQFISAAEVEKLCIVKGIQIRTGGLCNPGGTAKYFDLAPNLIRNRYHLGSRCGDEKDLVDGKPIGSIRVSFGAMSTLDDAKALLRFICEYFVDDGLLQNDSSVDSTTSELFIEEIAVYPIKSCGPYVVPFDKRWSISADGLAWDREWCLVQEGTNVALSQKSCPRMALLNPMIDLDRRRLVVTFGETDCEKALEIPLDDQITDHSWLAFPCRNKGTRLQQAKVCGDVVQVQLYEDDKIKAFFSSVLGVSCTLARYPRHSSRREVKLRQPRNSIITSMSARNVGLANESPLLIVSQSSVDQLNSRIQMMSPPSTESSVKPVTARSFRANIVVKSFGASRPYAEDEWKSITISSSSGPRSESRHPGESAGLSNASDSADSISTSSMSDDEKLLTLSCQLDILGPCQRCQMVSIDQSTSRSQSEPFSTLAKTRRKGDGRVWFGVHASLAADAIEGGRLGTVMVGNRILPLI